MASNKNGFKSELLKSMVQLATAGFGVAAALAWNEAVKKFIDHFISAGAGFKSSLYYAIVVTVIAVAITYYLGRLTQKAEQEEEKNK